MSCKECNELEALQAEQAMASQKVRAQRYTHGRKHELAELEAEMAELEKTRAKLSENQQRFLAGQLQNRQYLLQNGREWDRVTALEEDLEQKAAMIRLELAHTPKTQEDSGGDRVKEAHDGA